MRYDIKKIDELYSKPSGYRFTGPEIEIIKSYLSKSSCIRCRYAFYRRKSSGDCYIAFIIDQDFNAIRRSGVESYWEYICDRPISDIELTELAENFGCHNRRFITYYYRDIDCLIHEDLKYDVTTPSLFVDESIERGYVKNKQTA